MSFFAKIRSFSLIIAVAAAFICPLFFGVFGVGVAASAEETDTGALAYEYIMSVPVAAAADKEALYVLTGNGRIVSVGAKTEAAGAADGAKRLAAFNGKLYTNDETDALSVFAGAVSGEITAGAVYLFGADKTVFATPAAGAEFTGGCADGDKLYVAEKAGSGRVSLYRYDLADNSAPRTLIKNEIKTDGEITAMTVAGGDLYYATPYSLYVAGNPKSFDVGGITSLTSDGERLYYTTRSGKLCRYGENGSETLLRAAEKISVATRKNFACFADYGNDTVTVVSENGRTTTEIAQPAGVAVDYAGTIYVASENKVATFTRALKKIPDGEIAFAGNDDYLTEVKIDMSDVAGNTLYAVTDSGVLLRTSDDKRLMGVSGVEISPAGGIFVMMSNGEVFRYDRALEKGVKVCSAGSYTDLAVDLAENVYRAGAGGIYRNDESEPVFEKAGIDEIALSMIELGGENAVAYGDLVAVSGLDCASVVMPRVKAGTDMKDDPNDKEYVKFIERAESGAANGEDYAVEIRKAVAVADVSAFPAEAATVREVNIGANVIVIDRYAESDYYYVIAEAGAGSVKGFVNSRTLSSPLELKKLYEETVCAPIAKADVYKYPSLIAPKVGVCTIGKTYPLLAFAEGYKDANGQGWCRISFSDAGGTHDGYVLRTNVSVDGTTGGENKQIVPDAVIKADSEFVDTFLDERGQFRLGQIASGTKIQLEEDFKKSNEYTKITYVSNEKTGSTTTCYVLTEYIKHTEAGWYQVIMFVVAGVILVAVAVIIVIRVKKKKKID